MKFSRIVTGVLSIALLAFMVSDTLAQGRGGGGRGGQGGFRGGPGGGFGGRGGPGGGDMTFTLLRVDEVKKEIDIQPDQEAALAKIAEQARPDFGGERPDFRNMSEEERTAFFERMNKEREERTAKMKAQLEEVLFPEQLDRLKEIGLQVRGVQAINDEEVASELKITSEQKSKLEEVREGLQSKMRDRMRELFSSGDRGAIQEEMEKVRKEMESEVLGVLTSDQRAQFDKMKGEPFDMPEDFGRGFGGFGGRGGPPGGGRGGFGGGRGGRGGDDGGRRGRPGRPESEN